MSAFRDTGTTVPFGLIAYSVCPTLLVPQMTHETLPCGHVLARPKGSQPAHACPACSATPLGSQLALPFVLL